MPRPGSKAPENIADASSNAISDAVTTKQKQKAVQDRDDRRQRRAEKKEEAKRLPTRQRKQHARMGINNDGVADDVRNTPGDKGFPPGTPPQGAYNGDEMEVDPYSPAGDEGFTPGTPPQGAHNDEEEEPYIDEATYKARLAARDAHDEAKERATKEALDLYRRTKDPKAFDGTLSPFYKPNNNNASGTMEERREFKWYWDPILMDWYWLNHENKRVYRPNMEFHPSPQPGSWQPETGA